MDDLARELGMSKKTLYEHFPTKAAVVEAAILAKFSDIERDFARITAASSENPLAALNRLLACVQFHTSEVQPPFLRDVLRDSPETFALVESRRRDLLHRHFGKLFNAGRRVGIIRTDIPVALMIEILLGTVEAIMNPERMTALGLTPKTGATAIIRVVLEGVITGKGRTRQ